MPREYMQVALADLEIRLIKGPINVEESGN